MPAEDADMTTTTDPGLDSDDRGRAAARRAAPVAA